MNMIEVDPKLFIKCRLCLDETGQYQIVPNVQMQIKYCFDIDVEPFDGLPQLVCKKCESILSQHAGIKQMFQEKQKNLKSKLSSNARTDNIIQQQQDTVSSTQTDTENRHKNKVEERLNRTTPVSTRRVSTESEISNNSQKTKKKKAKNTWKKSFIKYFICRFCNKSYKDIRSIYSHLQKQCKLYKKYSNINKKYCLVGLNKIKDHTTSPKPNITGSTENVVCDKNKIVQSSRANFYVLYTSKSEINKINKVESPESSEDDIFIYKKKSKRRRLISRSSDDTVVIDDNKTKTSENEKQDTVMESEIDKNVEMDSDIECVNIEDSDSNSTKSSVKTKDELPSEKTTTINDSMVNRIINTCYNKYKNRLNSAEGDNTVKDKEESSLKHKVLSIGRKVIHKNGLNTTGILRYMEHKNLEVVWISKMDPKVMIKTRTKESEDNDNNNLGWENISPPNHITKDFANDFERISNELSIDEHEEEQLNRDNLQHLTDKHGEEQSNQADVGTLVQANISENNQAGCNAKHFENPEETEKQTVEKISSSDAAPSKVDKQIGEHTFLRAVLDADKNWTKLLNANPVANPKQLPKKNAFNEPASIIKIFSNEVQNESECTEEPNTDKGNNMLHMPIITSTVSLAPVDCEQANDSSNQNGNESSNHKGVIPSFMPKIKVKPVSELMPERALIQQNNTFGSTPGWTITDTSQNKVLQSTSSNMIYIANPSFTNTIPVQHDVVYYPQSQVVNSVGLYNPVLVNPTAPKQPPKAQEYVKLHTVELPNTKTNSPFRYFQKLLQLHKMHLMESEDVLSPAMKCLMKFKVVFEQDSNSPVKLCLCLFCDNNLFCIKVKDDKMKELGLSQFLANWQWEILKVFKGDSIVPKLHASALKLGNNTYFHVTCFTNLLKSIVYSKEL